jgi:hypothetical protein
MPYFRTAGIGASSATGVSGSGIAGAIIRTTRLACRLLGWRVVRNRRRADRPFRGEQRFGCLARSGDPLAIVAARMWLVLSANQELLRKVIDTR